MTKIEFGTSGWRGQIAREFTFENVEYAAQGVADYVIENGGVNKGVVIGFDNRFLSPEFAQTCAKVLTANGIKVYLATEAVPSPLVSFAVLHYKTAGAIMITASHNPPNDNGFKVYGEHGELSGTEISDVIVEKIAHIQKNGGVKNNENKDLIHTLDVKKEYIESILRSVDKDIISKAKLKVVVNSNYGSGIGYTANILKSLGCEVIEINNYRNPAFGGKAPNVEEKNMVETLELMRQNDIDLGLATDGDADRFGIIEKSGRYVSSNEVLYLLMHYLYHTRGWKTCVFKTVSTTNMLNRMGEKYGIEVVDTPAGFKYIAKGFINHDAFLGGEESNGLAIKGHVPEKDGVLACLLIVEMIAKLGKPLSQMVEDLKAEVGYLYNDRIDVVCTDEVKEKVSETLKDYNPPSIAGHNVVRRITVDGVKLVMEDNSWALLRPSGTEPKYKVYAEGNSKEQVKEILEEVMRVTGLK